MHFFMGRKLFRNICSAKKKTVWDRFVTSSYVRSRLRDISDEKLGKIKFQQKNMTALGILTIRKAEDEYWQRYQPKGERR